MQSTINSTGISPRDTVLKADDRWLYRKKKNDVKAATFGRLLISMDLLEKYRIANIRLQDLCTDDVQDYLNALARDEYSSSTIKKGYHLLSGLIRYLLGEGFPVVPAFMNARIPNDEHIKKERRIVEAYTPEEQQKLKEAIQRTDTIGARATLLMLETGMRVGETLALHWSDVNWLRRALNVHSTLVYAQSRKKCFIQSSPKSKASKRQIPLSKAALDMLTRTRQSGDKLIFADQDGDSSIGYNTLRNQVKDLCDQAGVDYRGMHVFRHTFATNAFYKGCDIKILSKLLGHASVTITYNTYIHLYGDALEEMRSIVD